MAETDPSRPAPGRSPLLALADRCVQCGLCLPHCPTYRLDAAETESPRGRIAYMKAVAAGDLTPTRAGDLHLDHCLACRRCEGVCPAGVEYGQLLVAARSEQFRRKPASLATRSRLWLLARPRLLGGVFSLYRSFHPLPPERWRALPRPPSAGAETYPVAGAGRTALFAGCVAVPYEAAARSALAKLAAASGETLVLPTAQTCCGAAAVHAGDSVQADRLGAANAAAFAGNERVLCLASGCQGTLAGSLAGVSVVEDVLVFLAARAERLRFRSAGGRKVAVHRACTQVALPGSVAAMRKLLGLVPDLEVVELPDTGCCGAAGLYMLEFPERAERLRQDLFASFGSAADWGEALRGQARYTQARYGEPGLPGIQILSASHACRLHLANGSLVPVRHPVEFLAEYLA